MNVFPTVNYRIVNYFCTCHLLLTKFEYFMHGKDTIRKGHCYTTPNSICYHYFILYYSICYI